MGVEWQSEVMKETYSGRHFLLMKQRLKHSTIITYKAFIAFMKLKVAKRKQVRTKNANKRIKKAKKKD